MTNQQLAKVVHRNAQVQYDSLKRQPSLKWTWGADLDREDINDCSVQPIEAMSCHIPTMIIC
jgi:hypothetical protein